MTQRQAIRYTRLQLLEQFRSSFPELVHVAEKEEISSCVAISYLLYPQRRVTAIPPVIQSPGISNPP